jgi:hypothetical protein
MTLPNLRLWVTNQGPPTVADLIHHGVPDGDISLFPSLKGLDLDGEAAFEWLSLFLPAKNRAPPWVMAGNNLPLLTYHLPNVPIDSSLLSRLLPFTHLVDVFLDMGCFLRPCSSHFTDQDVENFAMSLPKLEALTLGGWPCGSNTCPTTVHSLLSLSIHCTKLRHLNIHFRTEDLGMDMMELIVHAYSQDLHLKPKCPLETLVTEGMYVKLGERDPIFIGLGMLMVFPSLSKFVSMSPLWTKLEVVVKGLAMMGESRVTLTENFARCINEARVRAESGGQNLPAVSSCRGSVQ